MITVHQPGLADSQWNRSGRTRVQSPQTAENSRRRLRRTLALRFTTLTRTGQLWPASVTTWRQAGRAQAAATVRTRRPPLAFSIPPSTSTSVFMWISAYHQHLNPQNTPLLLAFCLNTRPHIFSICTETLQPSTVLMSFWFQRQRRTVTSVLSSLRSDLQLLRLVWTAPGRSACRCSRAMVCFVLFVTWHLTSWLRRWVCERRAGIKCRRRTLAPGTPQVFLSIFYFYFFFSFIHFPRDKNAH